MAKEYKVGDRYYLPVCVNEIDSGYLYPVRIVFNNGDGNNEGHNAIKNEPDLLLTADEITEKRLGRAFSECYPTFEELKAERDKLKAENDSLRSQVGKLLAQIQDLNAEVHFHKEFGEGLDKQQKELQARYDELDSVNHEQAEKIRRQDKALTDLKQRNDKLRDENTNLTFLLEDKPEKEATKPVHVVLNNGTEVEFRRYTDVTYRTDYNILVIKDGEEIVAGFIRGDRPGNLAYWWTE